MKQELDLRTIKKGPLLFIMILGVFIPVTAYLMQRFMTRELFLTAMMAFLTGSIISGVAPGFEVLLIGRLIQAAGAGIIMPLLMNVVLAIFPEEKRGGAMGVIGVAIILAPAIGPAYAGYMLDHFMWRSLFYGIIPFAVLVITLAFFYLKNVGERAYPKLDIRGVILSTIGFGTLLYGFSRAGAIGWISTEVLLTLAVYHRYCHHDCDDHWFYFFNRFHKLYLSLASVHWQTNRNGVVHDANYNRRA